MPNGFHGPEEEWKRREAPLLELDDELQGWAERHGITIDKNYHGDEPNRMLRWNSGGFVKTIQISLEDLEQQTFFVAIYAWRDVGQQRDTKQFPPRWNIPLQRLKASLNTLLEECYLTLEAVNIAELKVSREIGRGLDLESAVVVKTFSDASAADRASGLLQASGIPTFVTGNKGLPHTLLSWLRPTRWHLLVAPEDRQQAEELLR